MPITILITKETRAFEKRVSMIPRDVHTLTQEGYTVFVEQDAGKNAGFPDKEYQEAGAYIRYLTTETLEDYKKFFNGIDIVVRAKRPDRSRETLENQAMARGTILIGALDPLENHSPHIAEYKNAGIIAHSLDQLDLDPHDPMNILAAMSRIAGRLALIDAIEKFHAVIHKVVIIGFGVVGQSAFQEAIHRQLPTTVILSNINSTKEIEEHGGSIVLIQRNDLLQKQQEIVRNHIRDANIVITSARKANQAAPLLIPLETLQTMEPGSVIVDMALSEGGNVEGSEHDKTRLLGNNVIITNVSGYPKKLPREASELWSTASLHFLQQLRRPY